MSNVFPYFDKIYILLSKVHSFYCIVAPELGYYYFLKKSYNMQIRNELVKSTETWSNFKQNEHQMTFTSEGILQKQVWHPQK